MIRSLRSLGKTILLTTHYLDEAEQLSDRVAVLREGRDRRARPARGARRRGARDRDPLPARRRGGRRLDPRADARPARADAQALAEGRELEGLEVRRPTLEEIYLELTADDERMRLLLHQLRGEQRLYWRSRELAFFTFLFPVDLLRPARLGLRQRQDQDETASRARAYLLAGMLGYGVASTAFAGLAIIARHPARERDPQAAPRDAAAAGAYLVGVIAST